VNGKLTLSENIADLAGLSAAYDGYRLAFGGKPAPDSQGFTGDQRFFVAFDRFGRGKQRPEAMRLQLATDGHAPEEYRADTVRNIDGGTALLIFDRAASYILRLMPGSEFGKKAEVRG